jgi:hypothetical protein
MTVNIAISLLVTVVVFGLIIRQIALRKAEAADHEAPQLTKAKQSA